MAEITTQEVKDYLKKVEGKITSLQEIRAEFRITPDSKSFDTVRNIMFRLDDKKVVKALGQGKYKVITTVKRVRVFGKERERKPPFELFFPRDFETMHQMCFADNIVIREGDIVVVGGMSNWGKTTIALNFCGENIDYLPVLMGNEYTTRVGDTDEYEPTPRFLNRIDNMDWIHWTNGDGEDKFELLPVKEDYAEHIVKDRINIIDWINLDGGKLYEISKVMDDIKAELGRGVAILVLQKSEGSETARGGQFVKDFTDCELSIDKYTETQSMITIGKVKEYRGKTIGRTFAYGIQEGVKIVNFREIVKCPSCHGKKWVRSGSNSKPCENCFQSGYLDL